MDATTVDLRLEAVAERFRCHKRKPRLHRTVGDEGKFAVQCRGLVGRKSTSRSFVQLRVESFQKQILEDPEWLLAEKIENERMERERVSRRKRFRSE